MAGIVGKKRVIVLTDGDHRAYQALKVACDRLGLGVVRDTQGNPTPLRGRSLIEAIVQTPGDPVVAMVDDRGDPERGRGERALEEILKSPRLAVLGVIAVAAHTKGVRGVEPDSSVTARARLTKGAVTKEGKPAGAILRGDTVDVLARYPKVPVVGLGDPGKMEGADDPAQGAPATRRALQEILRREGSERNGSPVSSPG